MYFFKFCVSMSVIEKLTRIADVDGGYPGISYETVCQLSKQNKTQRKRYSTG